jgi:FkbM family methyltransferase
MHKMIASEKELSKLEITNLIGRVDKVILDIGCYDGEDSRELDSYLYDAEFFCFEADPRSQMLFNTFNNLKNFHLIPVAVGNIDGIVNLNLSDSETRRHHPGQRSWSASSSLKKPLRHLELFKDVEFNNTVMVPCIKLDTWFYQWTLWIKKIDFIWCDINGAEENFILGATETLKQTRFLYIEFSDSELYEGQISKDKILELLPDFELMGIYNFKGNFGNLLLKNKKL